VHFQCLTQLKETPVTERTETAPTRAQNISNSLRRKWQDPDYRAKMDAYFAKRREDPEKLWSRRGIPNGLTRAEATEMWRECNESAAQTVHALEANGTLGDGSVEDAYAREALEMAISIMRSECGERIRLKAARLVADFTMPKARRRANAVSVTTAEDWIDALTQQ
jgi:hypothetical protein